MSYIKIKPKKWYAGIPKLLWVGLSLNILIMASLFFVQYSERVIINFALFLMTLGFIIFLTAIVSFHFSKSEEFAHLVFGPVFSGVVGAFVFYLLTETGQVNPIVFVMILLLFIMHIMSVYYLLKPNAHPLPAPPQRLPAQSSEHTQSLKNTP